MNKQLDTETLKAIFHSLLKISLGLADKGDGSFAAPIPHDPNETLDDIDELMKDQDDEAHYMGRETIAEVSELQSFESILDRSQVRQIGLLRLRAVIEHLQQMNHELTFKLDQLRGADQNLQGSYLFGTAASVKLT